MSTIQWLVRALGVTRLQAGEHVAMLIRSVADGVPVKPLELWGCRCNRC